MLFFFFNDTATTEIYTLSLHDALPIHSAFHTPHSASLTIGRLHYDGGGDWYAGPSALPNLLAAIRRSEEHTSELQSRLHLVCRLLLEKKKKMSTPEAQLCYL